MSFYQHHVFFCTNQREGGKPCCNDFMAQTIRDYVKGKIKELGISGEGRVRVNQAGCLGRCEEGPVLVVYPEGIWYRYENKDDIDEVIEQHLQGGNVVKRLQINK
ncbi:MAG: (2Fe-2S) ferredoxin domain-containing protein [Methylococcales bacterium]|jgi:(2Fe-2S) ferredoxin|nr:(2Fe-2S) ferredoxin domain-containing protein [Methylococcales bacterium]MBT7444063.1 (2Fe-2S) ferredoxin domain-containing protein [Methylococcales bacterium]